MENKKLSHMRELFVLVHCRNMQLLPIKFRTVKPPKDDLFAALKKSRLTLKDGDIIAISSKVVSIGEGRTIPIENTEKKKLVQSEADWFFMPSKSLYRRMFTISRGVLVGAAGVDESNGDGHYILYPVDPQKSAARLRSWLMKEYNVANLGVIITDSVSIPLRRGAVGIALGYAGFVPLKDYRGKKDLFGREFAFEVSNIADGLAAAATVVMGEGDEGTPVVVIRNVPGIKFGAYAKNKEPLVVTPEKDLFAPLLWNAKWKKGGKSN
jgi:coenzyme F420-0:L-glutamate ligase